MHLRQREAALAEAAAELRRSSHRPSSSVDDGACRGGRSLVGRRGRKGGQRHHLKQFGAIDILVNNVGAAKGAGIVDTPDEVWQEAFDQTLYPAIRMSRLVVPHMKKQGAARL